MINFSKSYFLNSMGSLSKIQSNFEGLIAAGTRTSCFDQPQVRSSSMLSRIDPDWVSFDSNLQEEGFSSDKITSFKEEFSNQVMDLDQPLSSRMKELYRKILPKNGDSQIELIRNRLNDTLKSLFFKILNNPLDDDGAFLADFESEFVNQLKTMSALGKTEYLKRYIFLKAKSSSIEEHRSFAQNLLSSSWEKCKKGKPAVFNMAPILLHEQVMDSDIVQRLIERFAALGVEEVRDDFASSLTRGSPTSYNPTTCPASIDRRLELLRDMAFDGHLPSQRNYAIFLLHNTLHSTVISNVGKDQFDKGKRLSEFKKLVDCETKINSWVTRFYAFNGSEYLDAQLSVEERLNKLEMRANTGDKYAFSLLYNAYKNNFLYSISPRILCLNLTNQERWEKICAMSAIDLKAWNHHLQFDYLKGYIESAENEPSIVIPLSKEERYAWILENAFDDLSTEQAAAQLLRYQLQDEDQVPHFKTFKERLNGLFRLALKGSSKASEEIRRLLSQYNHDEIDLPCEKIEFFEMLTSLALAGDPIAQGQVVAILLQPRWGSLPNKLRGLNLDPTDYDSVLRELAWSSRDSLSMEIIRLYFNHQRQADLENLLILCNALNIIRDPDPYPLQRFVTP